MEDIRVVFMGTTDFSAYVLEGVIDNYQVVGVVSQPDRKVGRKKELTFPPVKEVALNNNILVLQPGRIREEYEQVLALKPDLIVTCAYGQILSKEILEYPRLGCINVHASLLPKLRGGAPIHRALIEGHAKTGITIMYMDQGMDDGDIISKREVEILDSDNLESLQDKLKVIGRDLLIEVLPSIIEGTNNRIVQDEAEVTYAYTITREEEHLDFNKTTLEVFNKIRGLSPNPGVYVILDDVSFKIYRSRIGSFDTSNKEIGEICQIYKDGIGVSTKDGEIIITEIKPFGKKKMSVSSYLNGVDSNSLLGKVFK